MKVEEITGKFAYKLSPTYDLVNTVKVSVQDAIKTFREHDDVLRLDDQDDGPIYCSKFFNDYYILATGIVKTQDKSITILDAKRIPVKFINTLPSKDFVTIVDSFYNKVSPNFGNNKQTVFKKTITDPTSKQELMQLAMMSVIEHDEYKKLQNEYK